MKASIKLLLTLAAVLCVPKVASAGSSWVPEVCRVGEPNIHAGQGVYQGKGEGCGWSLGKAGESGYLEAVVFFEDWQEYLKVIKQTVASFSTVPTYKHFSLGVCNSEGVYNNAPGSSNDGLAYADCGSWIIVFNFKGDAGYAEVIPAAKRLTTIKWPQAR